MWTIYALKLSYDAYVKVVELASCREGAMYKLQYNPEYWTFSVNPIVEFCIILYDSV